MIKNKWYLGTLKSNRNIHNKVYLEDFEWACGWYWSGGYIGNEDFHCHFNGCFLDTPDTRGHPFGNFKDPWTKLPDYAKPEDYAIISNGASVWEPVSFFLNDAQYTERQWWRIKDLFKQFYAIKEAAEVFQYGGHCTSDKRSDAETNKEMSDKLNAHIKDVIIPEIRKALNKENGIE